MRLLSMIVAVAFLSLRGFASSFGLAQNVDMLSTSRKSSLASTTANDASITCNDIDTDIHDKHDSNGQKSPDKTPRLVKFVASRTHSTPHLPLPTAPATLDDFFSKKQNCNLLFSAKATLSEIDKPTPELYEMLKDSYSYFSDSFDTTSSSPTTKPSVPVRFIELANAPMRFIGVTLHSTATVGIQYLQESDFPQSTHFGPEFHFYLLCTNLQARGPPPLVWLFYKLIGKSQNGTSTSKASSRFQTSGFTRVWAERVSRDENKLLQFHNMARLESRLRIPSVLLSLMPFSVQHLEERGSASLQDAIDKDMEPAAERFQEAYEKWLAEIEQ